MSNCYDLNTIRFFAIDQEKRESTEQVTPCVEGADDPALWILGDLSQGAVEFGVKAFSDLSTSGQIPIKCCFVVSRGLAVKLKFLNGHGEA